VWVYSISMCSQYVLIKLCLPPTNVFSMCSQCVLIKLCFPPTKFSMCSQCVLIKLCFPPTKFSICSQCLLIKLCFPPTQFSMCSPTCSQWHHTLSCILCPKVILFITHISCPKGRDLQIYLFWDCPKLILNFILFFVMG
jgi:hypothetical protein